MTGREELSKIFDRALLCAVIVFMLASTGCATLEPLGAPPQHVVFVDTYGSLVDPTGGLQCNEEHEREHRKLLAELGNEPKAAKWQWNPCFGKSTLLFRRDVASPPAYFEDMFAEIRAFQREVERERLDRGSIRGQVVEEPQVEEVRKVTIVVHGGLVTNTTNLQISREVAPLMRADGHYPVFIAWQSNLGGSLFDSHFKIHNGQNRGIGLWSAMAPFKFAGDVVDGMMHLLPNLYSHFNREMIRGATPFREPDKKADANYAALRWKFEDCRGSEDCDAIAISKGPWAWTTEEGTRSSDQNFVFTVLIPTKIATMPLIDGLGTSAWDAMLRHVHIAFRHEDGKSVASKWEGWPENARVIMKDGSRCPPEEPVVADTRAERQWGGAGAVSLLMRRLQREMRCTPDEISWEVNLIGHSMGAIMVNEILRQFPDIPFSNVVYLASAATLDDYEMSALPYLLRHREAEKPPHVWHLTLHPFAELRETYGFGMLPSGSLLVWIDEFLADPIHFRERTAGRYENLMMVLPYTPLKIRPLIHVRTFGVGERINYSDPQNHGGFLLRTNLTEQPSFWSKEFWMPDGPEESLAERPRPTEAFMNGEAFGRTVESSQCLSQALKNPGSSGASEFLRGCLFSSRNPRRSCKAIQREHEREHCGDSPTARAEEWRRHEPRMRLIHTALEECARGYWRCDDKDKKNKRWYCPCNAG